ncbi:MAG: exo-alpha-sialidase [Methyloprofundus sp.]|nr:exo-alpha-sialidase [Methyloprofundus sp.]
MKKILTIYLLLLLFSPISHAAHNNLPVKIIKNTLAATLAQDGTLWRLLPTKDFVYLDYSKDLGKNYSIPVRVNQQAQKISAWSENPPAILVTKPGRILVLYYADEQQKSTSYFSYSDDQGKTFSSPALISDQATTDMHYMDKMLLDRSGNIHFFWHDSRNKAENSKLSGSISLYHAQTKMIGIGEFKNELITHSVCSCCRTAISLSAQGDPVLLIRMAFPDGTRDHVLLSKKSATEWGNVKRISDDHWVIDACPEHGPALAIDKLGRSHLTWFSLGDKRQGIFYAQTDNAGETVSKPMPLGNSEFLASHPDVLAIEQRVVLAWTEYNGSETNLYSQQSDNRGESWQPAKKMLSSMGSVGYPKLLSHNGRVFISWVTKKEGHQFIEVR